MDSVLYLGVEGVLYERGSKPSSAGRRSQRDAHAGESSLLGPIAQIVSGFPELSIVLNSWRVADIGYRNVVQQLPRELAEKIVGATMPGNRIHHRSPATSRVALLREDVKRRAPLHLTILDASPAAIPIEYLHRSLLAESIDCEHLDRFLSSFIGLLRVTE